MPSRTLIGALGAMHIWLAGLALLSMAPIAAHANPVHGTPASPGALVRATDAAWGQLDNAGRQRAQARADKAALAKVYQQQLAELDRLKRQRASWRRDRMLRSQMSVSHATAERLAELDRRLRALDELVAAHSRIVARSIEKELGRGPTAARRRELMRRRSVVRRSLRPEVKKIIVPDVRIDPLADPEELEYQAALLEESEEELAAQLARLEGLAARYQRMVTLRDKRIRAGELSALGPVDDAPRRSTGRSGAREAPTGASDGTGDVGVSDGPQPSSPPDSPPSTEAPPGPDSPVWPTEAETDPGRQGPMFDVIFADVVDASTLSALRAAELSADPAVKARAALRARQQVEARLERLKKHRALMQRRARELRGE